MKVTKLSVRLLLCTAAALSVPINFFPVATFVLIAVMVPFEGNAPQLAATVITLVTLGSIALPLRIYVRASNRALGMDDWLAIVSVVR